MQEHASPDCRPLRQPLWLESLDHKSMTMNYKGSNALSMIQHTTCELEWVWNECNILFRDRSINLGTVYLMVCGRTKLPSVAAYWSTGYKIEVELQWNTLNTDSMLCCQWTQACWYLSLWFQWTMWKDRTILYSYIGLYTYTCI